MRKGFSASPTAHRAWRRMVVDGDVLTSGGVTSGIDLGLHLIELDRGRDAALREAARIEHDLRVPVLKTGATR